ncbi:MAG TPA: DUF2971 domain-containing protein [Gallionella sp.]|nr:DUF2971 domain-containing protein [Gallionella sp.]
MWIDEFLTLMSSSTITLDAIERAYELKDKNLPNKLYKFRAINSNSISNFENDTVWLCSADKYNDPYECATTWSTQDVLRQHSKSNIDQLLGHASLEKHLSPMEIDAIKASDDPLVELTKCSIGKHKDISPEKQDELIAALLKTSNDIASENISRMNEFIQQGTKICSFSSRLDSVVMWGHYANSHTGFALEYDITTWPRADIRRRILHPVIYKHTLFDSTKYHLQAITERKNFNNLFGAIAAIHKSPDWSYENEWRFVLPMGKTFPDQNYAMPIPSALYLGSRISDHDKNTLQAIANKKKIPVSQMSLSSFEFKLVPHPRGSATANS